MARALVDRNELTILTAQDYAIFAALQQDGRTPFTALADRFGVSEAHVRRRVKQLTDADMFAVTAVADPRVLGLECMAWIGFVAQPAFTYELANRLVKTPKVDYVVISSGRFNVMAEVACASTADLDAILVELRALPGVVRTETFIYLALARQQFQWFPQQNGSVTPDHRPTAVTGGLRELEAIDIAIIRELEHDGRASFRDIARRLDVSERLVSSRFSDLVEDNVLKVMAVGNPLNLGFNAMAWLGITAAPGSDRDAIVAALGRIPAVDYVVVASGRYDLMAELVCRDTEELLTRLTDDVGGVEGVAYVETFYYVRLFYPSSAGAWGVGRTLAAYQPGVASS